MRNLIVIFMFLVGASSAQAMKPDLQCFEDLSPDAANVLDVFLQKNRYGATYQIIKVHYGIEIKGYGKLYAGQTYDNSKNDLNYLDNGKCDEGVSLNLIKQGAVHALIFRCSVDSGPSDWLKVAELVCY